MTKFNTSTHMRVTLTKSVIACNTKQRLCVQGLGLRRLNSTRVLENTQANKGMVSKVKFLLDVVYGSAEELS